MVRIFIEPSGEELVNPFLFPNNKITIVSPVIFHSSIFYRIRTEHELRAFMFEHKIDPKKLTTQLSGAPTVRKYNKIHISDSGCGVTPENRPDCTFVSVFESKKHPQEIICKRCYERVFRKHTQSQIEYLTVLMKKRKDRLTTSEKNYMAQLVKAGIIDSQGRILVDESMVEIVSKSDM